MQVNGVDLLATISNFQATLDRLQSMVHSLQSVVTEQNNTISQLHLQLQSGEGTLANLSSSTIMQQSSVLALDDKVTNSSRSIGGIDSSLTNINASIVSLEKRYTEILVNISSAQMEARPFLQQAVFASAGPYSWTVPNGVTHVRLTLAGGGTCSGYSNPTGQTVMALGSTMLVALGGNNTAHGVAYATNIPAGTETELLTLTGGGAAGAVGYAIGGGNGGLLKYTTSVHSGQILSGVVGTNAVNPSRVQYDGEAAQGFVVIEYIAL